MDKEWTVNDKENVLEEWLRPRLDPIGRWQIARLVRGDVRRAQVFALR